MRHGFPIRVDIYDHDLIFNSNCSRTTIEINDIGLQLTEIIFLVKEMGRGRFSGSMYLVWKYDCSLT